LGLSGAAGALAFAWVAVAPAQESEIAWDDAPEAVRAAITEHLLAAVGGEIETEMEDGVMIYEAEVEIGEYETSIEVGADGTLLEREEQIADAALSEPMLEAISGAAPGAEILTVSRVTSGPDKVETIEVTVSVGGETREIDLTSQGELIADDDDDEGDVDDDDDDDGDDHHGVGDDD
jgi:hypothetical protein